MTKRKSKTRRSEPQTKKRKLENAKRDTLNKTETSSQSSDRITPEKSDRPTRRHRSQTQKEGSAKKISKKTKKRQEQDPSQYLQEQFHFTLLTSTDDKPEYIVLKPVHLLEGGYGVFAAKTIPQNTLLGQYTGQQVNAVSDEDQYTMNMGEGEDPIDAKEMGNFTRFINHAEYDEESTYFELGYDSDANPVCYVITSKTIMEGQQILINYNVYSEADQKNFFYLNASDNDCSAHEFYEKNKECYWPYPGIDCPHLSIVKADLLAMPGPPKKKLSEEELKAHYQKIINFPILKFATKGSNHNNGSQSSSEIMSYSDFDSPTLLMYHSYRGNINAVRSDIQSGALLNRQQHRSGKTALHHAVHGLAECNLAWKRHNQLLVTTAITDRLLRTIQRLQATQEEYLLVIKELLQANALLVAQQQSVPSCIIQDVNSSTPFHEMITCLTSSQFSVILDAFKLHSEFSGSTQEMLALVNDKEQDLFLYAIAQQKIKHFALLVKAFPGNLKPAFDNKYLTNKSFSEMITTLSKQDNQELMKLMEEEKVPQNYVTIVKEHLKASVSRAKNDVISLSSDDSDDEMTLGVKI